MRYSEAITIVCGLAAANAIDGTDVAFGDEGLEEQAAWRRSAVATLHGVAARGDEIDARYRHPESDLRDGAGPADRSLDPELPLDAMRICLDAASELPAVERRARTAVALVEDFVVRHGAVFASSFDLAAGGRRP